MYFYFKIFWKKFLILVLLPYTHYYVIYFTFYYRCYSEKICQDLSRKFHVIVKNDKNDIMPNVKKINFQIQIWTKTEIAKTIYTEYCIYDWSTNRYLCLMSIYVYVSDTVGKKRG